MHAPGRILILWNLVEDDEYERLRAAGPTPLDWDPTRTASEVATIAEELDQMAAALAGAGHTVEIVNIRDDLGALVGAIQRFDPDAVLNLVEQFGDDPAHEFHVAGLYELLGVPYTGARPSSLALCQRKPRTKAVLRASGLPTARFFVVSGRVGDDRAPHAHRLRFPLIVKPALADASIGIELDSVVRDQAALEERVAQVLRDHKMPVLVEEYIDGREIHCALIASGPSGREPPHPLPLFEMEFEERIGDDGAPLPKIITYGAKWDPHSKDFYSMDGRCPAEDLEPEVVAHIQDVAVRAWQAVGCRDYARIDMRLDGATGEPFILDVNPNPDLADGGAFMQCAGASGRTFAGTLDEIVGFALARGRDRPRRPTPAPELRARIDQIARRRGV
jgi:D-alanine-D-alanine ligase